MVNKIIEELYRKHIVRDIIHNIAHGRESHANLQDLEQDIYMILLSQDKDLIIDLYQKNELNYWLANVIYTQLRSRTSPFYTKYKKLITSDELY